MVSGTYFSESNSARTELNLMFLCSIIVVDWGDWGGISPWWSSFRNEMGCQKWECNKLSIAASLKAIFAAMPEKIHYFVCCYIFISLRFSLSSGRYCEIIRASVGITVGLVHGILICCFFNWRLNVNIYRLSSRHWKETSVEGYIIVFPFLFFFLLPNIQCKWQMSF